MEQQSRDFRRPNFLERVFNRFFGQLVSLGFGLSHNYLLQVRGRKTGKMHATPVNVLLYGNRLFLVAGRGYTQWVRNALAAQQVTLKKGRVRLEFRLRDVPDREKPEILKAYVNRFRRTVQRYFSVPADSALDAFAQVAHRYPVFELIREG